jgi:hypothetical protein
LTHYYRKFITFILNSTSPRRFSPLKGMCSHPLHHWIHIQKCAHTHISMQIHIEICVCTLLNTYPMVKRVRAHSLKGTFNFTLLSPQRAPLPLRSRTQAQPPRGGGRKWSPQTEAPTMLSESLESKYLKSKLPSVILGIFPCTSLRM